jgi:hypothetical protein
MPRSSATATICVRLSAPAAAAVPKTTSSAHGPPVKWYTFTPVKIRPSVERAALATLWVLEGFMEFIVFVAVERRAVCWAVRGLVIFRSLDVLVKISRR